MATVKQNRRQRRAEQGKGGRMPLDLQTVNRRKSRMRGIDPDAPDLGPHLEPVDPQGNRRTFAASEAWIDASFTTDYTADNTAVTWAIPNATPKEQCRCLRCGHLNPPINLSAKGYCDDCRFFELDRGQHRLQGSTSSVAMKRVKRARVSGDEITPGGM